jgi:hypothetical protein
MTLVSDGLLHCCMVEGQPCTVSDDCCTTLICWNYGGTTGRRCKYP